MTNAVGSDRVTREDDRVRVDAAAAMPDWRPTRFRRLAVLFRDRTYFVAAAEEREGRFSYWLAPWPDDLHDQPRALVRYDEAFVSDRDLRLERRRRAGRVAALLTVLSPLIGFLPACLKLRWHDRFGLDPVSATARSVLIERLLLAPGAAMVLIGSLTGVFGAWVVPVFLLELAMVVDMIFRTDGLLAGTVRQPGFWEWALWWRRGGQ